MGPPRSAHSSPGSTHSAPAFLPSEHHVPSELPPAQYPLQPAMAGLFDPLSSLPTYEPPAAAHNGTIAESNFADMSMLGALPPTSFVLDDFTSMYDGMGQSAFDMRGNLNYDLVDNWGTLESGP